MGYIKELSQISYKDIKDYGGKSCSLGQMLQADITVPPGLAVNTQAQHDFEGRSFSKEFKDELRVLFNQASLSRVAVRSSAVAEDSADASWAGQLETCLNVSFDDIEKAIRKCWKSIRSPEALAYASDKRLGADELLVGVVIQSMVDSDVSGVMFTANPITGDRSQVMIEGLYGLGEMLVQGIVTPDRYTVSSKKMTDIDFEIAVKTKQMVYRDKKNHIDKVPAEKEDKAVLKEEQVIRLARLGILIEKFYGKPQDIEWALHDSRFYIIQARPITTLNK